MVKVKQKTNLVVELLRGWEYSFFFFPKTRVQFIAAKEDSSQVPAPPVPVDLTTHVTYICTYTHIYTYELIYIHTCTEIYMNKHYIF